MRIFLPLASAFLATCLMTTNGASVETRRQDLPTKLRLDVLEATLRHKLKAQPLAKGANCYVYVNEGLGRGIEARLTEYRIIVRSGDVGPTPPKQRWYWLDIGKVTEREAFVTIQNAQSGLKLVQLRKEGARWIFVKETALYLTKSGKGTEWEEKEGQSLGLCCLENPIARGHRASQKGSQSFFPRCSLCEAQPGRGGERGHDDDYPRIQSSSTRVDYCGFSADRRCTSPPGSRSRDCRRDRISPKARCRGRDLSAGEDILVWSPVHRQPADEFHHNCAGNIRRG